MKNNRYLHIYLFNQDTVRKYGVLETTRLNKYVKRIDANYEDLEKANWVIEISSINGKIVSNIEE